MPNVLILKNSSTAGAAPLPAQLLPGEVAINTTDGHLYTELQSGIVVPPNIWKIHEISGAQVLSPWLIYAPTDSSTYSLPLSTAVPVGSWVMIEMLDRYSAGAPVVATQAPDVIQPSGAPVTSVNMSGITALRFVNSGAGTWSY